MPKAPAIRKYQPIWEEIKRRHLASIAAPPHMHSRIIMSVRKEKNLDLGWKLLTSETGVKYQLEDTSAGNLLTFKLVDLRTKLKYTIDTL